MKLLIDLGNTRLKWALWNQGLLGAHAFPAPKGDIDKALDRVFEVLPDVEQAALVSVADAGKTQAVRDWLTTKRNLEAVEVKAGHQAFGVTNEYKKPETLGADRWVALIAAWQSHKEAVIVIDCGTAVTVDALDNNGHFRGGVILPGHLLMRDSLSQAAAGIEVQAMSSTRPWGKTTDEAVTVGSVLGLAGAIERVVKEQQQGLDRETRVLLTGGDADTVKPHLPVTYEHVPDLIFQGLATMTGESVAL